MKTNKTCIYLCRRLLISVMALYIDSLGKKQMIIIIMIMIMIKNTSKGTACIPDQHTIVQNLDKIKSRGNKIII